MKQSQFYYLLRRGLFSAGSAIIKNGLVMFNKFTTAGLNFPAQGSAEFNGTSDFITTPRPLDGTLSDYTISFWMNASTGTAVAFGTDGDTTNYALAYKNASTMRWEVRGTFSSPTSFTLSSSVNPWTNEWIYCTIRVESNNGAFYFNGSKDTTAFAGPLNFSSDFIIGGYGGGALKLDGNLANVAIWNRALTSDEINSVMWKSYEGLTGAESNGLQAWYSLDDITSPAASLANMEQLATDKDATIENKAAITAAINALS